MKQNYQAIADFINLIDNDPTATIIVQDNQYLDFFIKQLNQDRLSKGKQAWLSPHIYTIGVWTKELWNRLHLHKASLGCDLPKLLDPLSERLALGKLVHKWNEKHNRKLLNVEGTASAIVKGWRWLCQYNCLPKLPYYAESFPINSANGQADLAQISQDFINHIQNSGQSLHAINEDHIFFIEIAQEYCRTMEEASALSGLLLPNALIYFMKLLPAEALPIGKRLIFANFIEYTYPQLSAWQQALTTLGSQIETPIYKNAPASELNLIGSLKDDKVIAPFDNFEQELSQAISYIKPKLIDPSYSAALIIPEHNEAIYRMLDKYINPQILFTEGDKKRSYKANSGLSLLKTPLGSDLGAVILLAGHRLSRWQLLNLVQNSFIEGSQVEFSQRCHLYEKVCQDYRSEYTLKDLYDLAQQTGCSHLANLAALTAQFTPAQSHQLGQTFKKLKENYRQTAATTKLTPRAMAKAKAETLVLNWPQEKGHLNYGLGNSKYPLPLWIDYCRALLKVWFTCPQEANAKLIILTYMARLRSFSSLTNYYALDKLTFHDFWRYLRLGLSNVKLPISECTEEAARFNVLNLRKALRRHFSELILVGFNSESFPTPPKYQGFIPQQLLADLGWPRGSGSLCLQTALENLQTIRHCANRVILSFANNIAKNGGTVAAEVSPLWQEPSLKCVLKDNYGQLSDPSSSTSEIAKPSHLEVATNSYPLATYGLAPLPKKLADNIREAVAEAAPFPARPNKLEKDGTLSFQGGVRVISAMANCPLQALLCHRLGCSLRSEEIKNGFDTSIDRGNILHKCLQKFWEEYKREPNSQGLSSRSQAIKSIFGLEELTSQEFDKIDFSLLETKIKKIVWQVLQGEAYQTLSQYVLANEEKAATATLLAWLKYELNPQVRQDFNVIALEEPITLAIGADPSQELPYSQLVCSGTIDRIDQLKHQQQALGNIIIDYKTGQAHNAVVNAWDPATDFTTNRQTRDYQLPLYAFASDQDTYHGLLFAKLKKDTFVGKANLANEAIKANLQGALESAPKSSGQDDNLGSWEVFKANCQKSFQALATQYLQGSCQRSRNKALCPNCQFKQLCHIGGTGDEVDSTSQFTP